MSSPSPAPLESQERAATRSKRFKILGSVVLVAGALWAANWFFWGGIESTDDSFVEGDVTSVSPQIGGRVSAVYFQDNAVVHKGDLLVDIDPRDAQAQLDGATAQFAAASAKLAQAQANLEIVKVTAIADKARAEKAFAGAKQQMEQARFNATAAKAEVERAREDRERYRRLFDATYASKQKLEAIEAEAKGNDAKWRAAEAASGSALSNVGQASEQVKSASTADSQIALREADVALAKAQVDQARADLDAASLNLSYTKVYAPADGRVTKKAVQIGDMVQKGQTLSQLVGPLPWIVANFKEVQLARMQPGQPVIVRIDAFPGQKFAAHVSSIQPGTGARFSLLPPENATGNFVKVVQRVPVKIEFDNPAEIPPSIAIGMSAEPKVEVGR